MERYFTRRFAAAWALLDRFRAAAAFLAAAVLSAGERFACVSRPSATAAGFFTRRFAAAWGAVDRFPGGCARGSLPAALAVADARKNLAVADARKNRWAAAAFLAAAVLSAGERFACASRPSATAAGFFSWLAIWLM